MTEMNTREAAAFLGLKPMTLRWYRSKGGGPRFIKGPKFVKYRLADLEVWKAARERVCTSTRDYSGLSAA